MFNCSLDPIEDDENLLTQEPVVGGQVGLDQLSDDQVLPLLLAMDADTLLNCSKASKRLLTLVSDREVFRSLLKKTDEFTKEKLEELKALKGRKGAPEMMPEVVIEAARRIPFSPIPLTASQLPQLPQLPELPALPQEEGGDGDRIVQEFVARLKNQVRVKVTIEGGWGNGNNTFDVDGKRLEKLITVAKEVAVKLTLVEVEECFPVLEKNTSILRIIAAHLEEQDEKLEMLKLFELFFPLLQFSKRWEIDLVALPDADLDDAWTSLANIPTSDGRICKLMAMPFLQNPLGTVRLNTLRRLWEISDEMIGFRTGTVEAQEFLGGRRSSLDLDAEWQRILEVIQ